LTRWHSAASGAAAVQPGTVACVGSAPPRVAVVGAGLAGLVAAWRLASAGLAVQLLECRSRAGGRARSHRGEGFVFEAWPAVVAQGDHRLQTVIEGAGLRHELLPLRPVISAIEHRGGVREADLRSLLDVHRLPGVRVLHALRLLRLPRLMARYAAHLDPEWPERAAALDDRSAAEFCRLYFGASVLDGFFGPRMAACAAADPEQMSRVQFLLQLWRQGLSRTGLLRGGLAELAETLAARLTLRTHCCVERLDTAPGGGICARVAGGEGWRVDAVILAIPAPQAARIALPLLGYSEREALAARRYAPGISVVAGLRRAFASQARQILVAGRARSPLAEVLLEPGVPGGRVPGGCGLASLRSSQAYAETHCDAPPESVCKDLLAAFEVLRPGAQRAVTFARAFQSAEATPRFDVGCYRALARFERVQADRRAEGRRLYFAGDYLVDASAEGAVVSAERAARALCADLLGAPPRAAPTSSRAGS
jgi:protoporphyrinogen/coproporphyrinogen III oxidase